MIVKSIGICSGDVISIVGSGGKTTLLFRLARELSLSNKVLVTTTTKIYFPHRSQFDFITWNEKDFLKYAEMTQKGIYVYGSSVDDKGKLIGVEPYILEKYVDYFTCVLVEADGSKRKPLKGWKENEPVVSKNTSKTIGVIPIDAIGKRVNEENVYALKEFMDITGTCLGDFIGINHIVALIFHKRGLFKNACGEKILFINKVDDIGIYANLLQDLEKGILKENNRGYINKIVSGSLKDGI